ncbi:MAG: phosphotransferase [Planctomycetes bacterium]|nr:phosphotransferase [Planctomycetota bacterium]
MPQASGRLLADSRTLASSLVPVLDHACGGRLGPITWFKADWQRGGAATGTATYRDDDGEQPVVIKLPVVERELLWTRRLQQAVPDDPVVPHLYDSGIELGGYDLAWLVMERFEHGPLGLHWHEDHLPRIAEAATRFHALAEPIEVDQPPRVEPWEELVAESQASVKLNAVEEPRRWTTALKALRDRLDEIVAEWRDRDVRQWLHGDMHLANAMSRHAMDAGSVSLIDLAEVHAGHWLEDAVYLERQLWARPKRMKRHKPVKLIAAARRRLGLTVEEDYPRLAMIRRVLLAGTAPSFIRSEGNPKHLAACREWLEKGLKELK